VSAANLVQQLLRAGHPDEIELSEVPYVLGAACVGGPHGRPTRACGRAASTSPPASPTAVFPVPHARAGGSSGG